MDAQFPQVAPDQSRQQAVFERLRTGILSGALPGGARLPPSRHLAEELGVARQVRTSNKTTLFIAITLFIQKAYTSRIRDNQNRLKLSSAI